MDGIILTALMDSINGRHQWMALMDGRTEQNNLGN
jgi:hypothetical protein